MCFFNQGQDYQLQNRNHTLPLISVHFIYGSGGHPNMFEELVLYKTPVRIFLSNQEEPLCGTVIRYDQKKGMLILHPRVVIPEKYVLKIEINDQPTVSKPNSGA
jgi:hypothetical protein